MRDRIAAWIWRQFDRLDIYPNQDGPSHQDDIFTWKQALERQVAVVPVEADGEDYPA